MGNMKIPVSQLARDYHMNSLLLFQRRSALEGERAKDISTKQLRDLMENLSIAVEKVDKLSKGINAAYEKTLRDWKAEELAQVLTGLDSRLFSLLAPGDSFAGLDEIIDLHSYLQVILRKEIMHLQISEAIFNIEMLIKTAFYCIYVYKNLCSGYSIISVIHDLIQKGNLESKLSTSMNSLQLHLHEICSSGELAFDMLYHHQKLHEMTVIPNMIHIKKQLKDINSACIMHSSQEDGVILSVTGQKSLQNLISLVGCCQGKRKLNLELSKKDSKYPLPKLKISIPQLISNDLKNLGIGDLVLEHWILTRVLNAEDQNYVAS